MVGSGSAVSWRRMGGSAQPIRALRQAGLQPIAARGSVRAELGEPEARPRGPSETNEAPTQNWMVAKLRTFQEVVVVNLAAEVRGGCPA